MAAQLPDDNGQRWEFARQAFMEIRDRLNAADILIQAQMAEIAQLKMQVGGGANTVKEPANKLIGKNVTPDKCDGTGSFVSWAKRYKIIAGSKDPRYRLILEYAGNSNVPITMDMVQQMTIHNAEDLVRDLYASLMVTTSQEPQKMVENTVEENGAEAWRQLHVRFDHQSAQSNLALMNKILNPDKVRKLADVPYAIAKWEDLVKRQENRTKEAVLLDSTRRAIIVNLCPEPMGDHLRTNMDRYDTYVKLKAAIQEYLDNKVQQSTPMDIDMAEETCAHCQDDSG